MPRPTQSLLLRAYRKTPCYSLVNETRDNNTVHKFQRELNHSQVTWYGSVRKKLVKAAVFALDGPPGNCSIAESTQPMLNVEVEAEATHWLQL